MLQTSCCLQTAFAGCNPPLRNCALRNPKLQLQRSKHCAILYKKPVTLMNTDPNMLLGSRLKRARVSAKLSQDFTAQTLGVTRQAVSKWETGASCPTARQLGELATMYCTCAHSLLFGEPFKQVKVQDLMRGQCRPVRSQKERENGRERVARPD